MILVEACVTSVDEAVEAQRVGADRVELCRALDTGGLTPTPELVRAVAAAVDVPVMAMARPREGDFVYTPAEIAEICRDAVEVLEAGADGVVLGALTPAGGIDEDTVGRLTGVTGGRSVTFHKAFDEVPDPVGALSRLEALGVDRVLTAGGAGPAVSQRGVLARLVGASSGRTTVMAGGAVRADHVVALVRGTGLGEVHARLEAVEDIVRALGDARMRSV